MQPSNKSLTLTLSPQPAPHLGPTRPLLHIIVKGSAWTVPFTAPPALPSAYTPAPLAPPTPTPTPILATPLDDPPALPGYTPSYLNPVPPTPSLGPSVSGYPTYLAFLSQLIPLQRALLLLNLQKAHFEYGEAIRRRRAALGEEDPAQEGEDEIKEVKNLLGECGLWSIVREKEEKAVAELEGWGAARADPNGEFQVVQIGSVVPLSGRWGRKLTQENAEDSRSSCTCHRGTSRRRPCQRSSRTSRSSAPKRSTTSSRRCFNS